MSSTSVLFLISLFLVKIVDCTISDNLTYLLTPNVDLSPECRKQLEQLDNSTLNQMYDAGTKSPNNPNSGNLYDFGNFDQCYNIETNTTYGKYCLGTKSYDFNGSYRAKSIVFINEPLKEGSVGLLTGLHYAICLPDKCKPEQFSNLQFSEEFCYSKNNEPELTVGAIFTIVLLSFFIILAALSTAYEIYLKCTKRKPKSDIFLAFSLMTNSYKLFKCSKRSDQFQCLNGLRALSMLWVIIGHEGTILVNTAILNAFDIFRFEANPLNFLLSDADLAIDIFLFNGGLLATYSFLLSHSKGVKFNPFQYYLHRILRLAPAFGVCILIYGNLLRYLSNGPIWANMDAVLGVKCRTEWWYDFLYIRNYARKGGCLPQTWYLSVDMQLFALSPLVLIPLVMNRKIGKIILGTLTILGIVIPIIVGYIYKLHLSDPYNYVFYYYFATHMNFGVYVIGMIFGYICHQLKQNGKNPKLSPPIMTCLWIVGVVSLIVSIYATNLITLSDYNRLSYSIYLGLHRQLFVLSIALIVYLCITGYGGIVNDFLSLPIFQFLTKIMYTTYLLHYAVIATRYFSIRTPLYFSNFDFWRQFWGDFAYTVVLASIFTLLFESPIPTLEKYIFKRKPKLHKGEMAAKETIALAIN